ncbi:hypothetical protein ACFQY9_17325 [Microvirga aerilata]|uniref:hypothetical protein n=1 Tax=Microvirga aerilata TaxID=670292 RepID=UPI003641ED5D
MANSTRKQTMQKYSQRRCQQRLTRFEVLGFASDRNVIRQIAQRLARNDGEAARLRAEPRCSLIGEPLEQGGILAALRVSPSWEPIST